MVRTLKSAIEADVREGVVIKMMDRKERVRFSIKKSKGLKASVGRSLKTMYAHPCAATRGSMVTSKYCRLQYHSQKNE